MTIEERREYNRKRRDEHRKEYSARRRKWNTEHREEHNARKKKYYAEHREEYNAIMRKRLAEDLNKNGVKKSNIRKRSRRILDRCHANLTGYEIHHCFGYEDPNKFIYIPKSLHIQIHQFLKDNEIPADSNHWNLIRELVNECE